MDEPTDGLDPNQKFTVREMIKSMAKEGKAIIISTHILEEVDAVSLRDPMAYTVDGILEARILEWVAFPSSRGSSRPRDQTQVSCTNCSTNTC